MIWWTLTILHVLCTAIGAGVVTFVIGCIVQEIVRAIRQSHRVATVHIRRNLAERRRPTWREWWFSFRREIFRSYSYLTIGFVIVPHDPSERLRASYHG